MLERVQIDGDWLRDTCLSGHWMQRGAKNDTAAGEPGAGTALAAARRTPARPDTASAVTESAGLGGASVASGAARPRVIRPAPWLHGLTQEQSLTSRDGGSGTHGAQEVQTIRGHITAG